MKSPEVKDAGEAKKDDNKDIKDDLDAAADPRGGYRFETVFTTKIDAAPPVPKTATDR